MPGDLRAPVRRSGTLGRRRFRLVGRDDTDARIRPIGHAAGRGRPSVARAGSRAGPRARPDVRGGRARGGHVAGSGSRILPDPDRTIRSLRPTKPRCRS
jgi:hypothetical protein